MTSSWVLFISGRTDWRSTIASTFRRRGAGGTSGLGSYLRPRCCEWWLCHIGSSRERERSGAVLPYIDEWAIFAEGKREVKGETNPEKERKKKAQRKKGRRETQPLAMTRPVEKQTGPLFSPALTVKRCFLIFRLWFEGWVGTTVLVKSPKRLLQDAPSQFAYLGIAMKSGTDRLPWRTGLCVLFHTHQLLIICVSPWTERWITRWIRWIWLRDSIRGRSRCLGIRSQGKCGGTRRNGDVGCWLATMAIMDFSVMSGSSCWYGITIRVIRVEGAGIDFWGDWEWAGSDVSLDHWHWGFRLGRQFLSLLWLRVDCWRDPLLGTNRDWDCGTRFVTTWFSARWIARIRIRIRHENWVANANGCGGRMVPIRWRAHGGGTKVGFWVFHHVWRDASMCYHCGWHWRWR